MNQQYPEYSNFQVFDIKLTNLSDELKRIIRTYEFETGNRIPLQNGNIVLDLKNQFNQSRQYQQRNDLDYFK